jgi:type IV secretory pathway VirB3-like protein
VDEQVNQHTLFIACTRPAMFLGVPTGAFILNGLVVMIIFIISKNFAYLLLALPIHYLFRIIVRKDVNQFNILYLWLQTKGRGRNKPFWGGTSISPLSLNSKNSRKLAWEEYRVSKN